MSDESNLPERVYISPGSYRAGKLWPAPHEDLPLLHPYIREDVAKAREAAAYEAAASSLEDRGSDGWAEHMMAEYAGVNAEAIRALTPDDARAALERVREEGMREGMKLATSVPVKELPYAFAAAIHAHREETK